MKYVCLTKDEIPVTSPESHCFASSSIASLDFSIVIGLNPKKFILETVAYTFLPECFSISPADAGRVAEHAAKNNTVETTAIDLRNFILLPSFDKMNQGKINKKILVVDVFCLLGFLS